MKYLTTPIYYVNDVPHVGSAYTTLAADVINRWWRLQGHETFFLTGTDEHGAKIAEAAAKHHQTPHDYADSIATQFQDAWTELAIAPDGFIRTTDPKHGRYVERFLQELYDAGVIYKGEYRGWYCVGCEEFKTETQIGPGNTCPIHLTMLTEVAEESYLFKLSAYQGQLVELIRSDTLRILPESRKNEVLGFIEHEGLRDVAISRQNVAWGIPLPWDTSHTVYVWVDALLNYWSAAQSDGPDFALGRRPFFPPHLQLVGKDILRFHAVIWPALLLATGQPLPDELFVHGFFTVNGQKMSKSLGNVIAPHELVETYGIDAARYLLMASVPFGADGDLSRDQMERLYTSDLANNLGNLVSRVQAMILRYCQGCVPQVASVSADYVAAYAQALSQYDLTRGIDVLRRTLDDLNAYIQAKEPWALAKAGSEAELHAVLGYLAESVYRIGLLYWPFLPETGEKIAGLFGASIASGAYDTLDAQPLVGGVQIQPVEPLFPRLDSL